MPLRPVSYSHDEDSESNVVVSFYLISADLQVGSYWDNTTTGDCCFTVDNFDPPPGREAERNLDPKGDCKMHYLSQRMCCISLILRVMIQPYIFLCVLASLQSYAVTIGPVADLVIANAQVSPDGFTKSSVFGASFILVAY